MTTRSLSKAELEQIFFYVEMVTKVMKLEFDLIQKYN